MKMLTLLGIFIFSISALAINGRTTYQAKIVKPDGYPLEASSVNFRFTILDPAASCVLYVEDYAAVNMTGTGGLISFALGAGTRTYPVSSTTFASVFDNATISFPCQSPGIYNPTLTDARKIVMQFQDSSGWQTLPAMAINAVPFAMYAGKSENSIQLNGKLDTAFVENSTLAALNCNPATHAITFNGVSFSCIPVGSSSSGITSVTTSGTVLSTGGTASAPVISIQAATISQDGYLTSLDYAEFKAKLSASSTQIINTLGYAPVSGAAVTTQINNSNLSGDVSGTISSNSVVSVGGKTAVQISTSVNDTLAATSSAAVDTIVKRNSSGNATFNDVYANAAKINYVDIYKPSTSFNIRLQAPTSLSTNYILNLPTTSGTTGQVLSTDGSGNLSWINPSTGSVVSVSAKAPLASTGGSTPTISITQATSSTDGYLSSTDWNAFNNKQAATSAAIIATLGYTPADNAASGTYAQKANNLSDLTSSTIARTNLGLGTLATANSIDLGSASATGIIADARLQTQSNVTSGTQYTKVTVDGKGRVTSGAQLSSFDVTTALGYTPANSTSGVTSLNGLTNQTQTFSVDIAGTSFGINSSGANHTFNIPLAASSSVTAGLLSNADYLTFTNKQNATSAAIIATLGYTPADNAASGTYAQKANNLSDLTSIATARTNLGLGALATANSIDLGSASATGTIADARLQVQSNVTSGTQYTKVTVDGKGRVTSGAQLSSSDVTTALGYTPANDSASGTYLVKASNLSDLTNISQARSNLGLGGFATVSSLDLGTASATGTLAVGRLPSFVGDATIAAASNTVVLSNSGVAAGTYTKVTVDAKGRVTSSSALASSDVTTALGYTPANSSSGVTSLNGSASQTQTFASSNAGTAFGISTSNGVHTFAIPLAASSTVTAGLLSNADYTTFTNKQNATSAAIIATLGYTPANATSATQWTTNGSNIYYNTGNIGVGVINPSAKLELAAGTASVAPLKFTSGTLLSSAQSGTMEYDGFNFYLTDSANTRRTIATGSSAGTIDNASNINSSGNITMTPVGSAIVSSTTASTNSSTGALVVKGGLGVAGAINAASNLNVSGSTVIDGSLKLSSMTSGSVLFAGANGTVTQDNSSLYWDGANKRLGIGGNSPAQTLSVSGTSYFSGNVGIGTTSPSVKIHITGSNNGPLELLRLENSDAGGRQSVIGFKNTGLTNPTTKIYGGGVSAGGDGTFKVTITNPSGTEQNVIEATNSSGTDPKLVFSTAGSERLRIDNVGNVGIGTTNPARKIHIKDQYPYIAFEDTENASGSVGTITYNQDANFYFDADNPSTGSDAGFRFRANGGTKNLLAIMNSGNVGIGTTGPTQKLHVGGSVQVDGDIYGGQYGGTRGIWRFSTADPNYGIFYTEASPDVISFSPNGGGISVPAMVISGSGNVGLGTTSPQEKLHVEATTGGRMQVGTGNIFSSTGYGTSLESDTDDGVVYLNAHTKSSGANVAAIAFRGGHGSAESATSRTIITFKTDTGNVGIGTTSPQSLLQISRTAGSNGNLILDGNSSSTGKPRLFIVDTNGGSVSTSPAYQIYNTNDLFSIGRSSNINTGPTDIFNINNSGNVGVGTTAPSTALTVLAPVAGGGIDITAIDGVADDNFGISWKIPAQGHELARINAEYPNSGSSGTGNLKFKVRDAGTLADRMTILGNGNVGIGTIIPAAKLDVDGLFQVDTLNSKILSDNFIEFSGTMAGSNDWPGCTDPARIYTLGTINASGNYYDSIEIEVIGSHRGYDTVNYIERRKYLLHIGDMVSSNLIESSGNPTVSLWNGTTVGDYNNMVATGTAIKLIVNPACGAGRVYSVNMKYSKTLNFTPSATRFSYVSHTSYSVVPHQPAIHIRGSNVGIGTTAPGYTLHVVGTAGLSTGTAWTNASDMRLKDIQGDYEYGLNEVLKLHTVRYNYKKDNALGLPSDFSKTGFIAQEVQKVIPDAVNVRKDGYLELNVDPIHWAVVNAVQDLYKLVVEIKNEILGEVRGLASIVESKADKTEIEVLKQKAANFEAKSDKLEAENAELKTKDEAKSKRLESLEAYLCSKDPNAPICK